MQKNDKLGNIFTSILVKSLLKKEKYNELHVVKAKLHSFSLWTGLITVSLAIPEVSFEIVE